METIIKALTILTLISGGLSAYFWYQSSKVMIIPAEEVGNAYRPLPVKGNTEEWIEAIYRGIEKTGRLNKFAAFFTALAVSASVIVSLLGTLNAT